MKTGNSETPGLIRLLVQCRAERGMTIPDVAKALKMSTGSISNLERGVGKPRRTTLVKLEQFLRRHGYFAKKAAA